MPAQSIFVAGLSPDEQGNDERNSRPYSFNAAEPTREYFASKLLKMHAKLLVVERQAMAAEGYCSYARNLNN
jgi:hypothetical protein